MTTYAEDEASVQGSAPIEIYTLTSSLGTYYLTSYDEDVTFGGILYASIAGLSRGNASHVTLGKTRELVVTMPVDHAFVQLWLANGGPPSSAEIKIDRIQAGGELGRIWRGEAKECDVDEEFGRFTVPNATDEAFAVRLPIATASRLCNHALYDEGCTLSRVPFTIVAVVDTIDGTDLVTLFMPKPDGWARFGEVIRDADGVRRGIVEQIGTAFTLDRAFGTLNQGDNLTIIAGCDHQITTCRDDFNNVENFGGHPDLPSKNPLLPFGIGIEA